MKSPTETYQDRIKEEKRLAAVDAATELFLQQGYERTSLQQIAKRADVSTATLFKRYPTKAALFEAIVEQFWTLDDDACGGVLPAEPKAGLLKIGRDYAERMRNPTMVAIFRLIIAEAPRFPDIGQMLFDRGIGPYLSRISAYLAETVAAGYMVVPNVESASRAFVAMIAGQVFWPELIVSGCGGTDEEMKRAVDEAVAIMMARYGKQRTEQTE
ncbi:TetR/AcrR family transcriptional regulator [Pectobacterium betavasculorum]|uniref:TetR/AcrR family transcriptional regulator n=1 Tax=Pectobacterium betavasculorum TaxID=55207 RepID=UPI00313F2F85